MEVLSIKGHEVSIVFARAERVAVGAHYTLLDGDGQGLVVQILAIDSLDYAGLEQELLQRLLEQPLAVTSLLDGEGSLADLRNLRVASARIHRRIRAGRWLPWDGWI